MDGLLQFIRTIGTGRLIAFGAVVLVAVLFFSTVVGEISKPTMGRLFTDMDPAEANRVVQELETQGVEYELGANGTMVLVPRDQLDRLRISLAGEGVVGQVIGKELFDLDQGFGQTSFELRVNYTRAIEGELTRTINSMNGVRGARVHLNIPETTALGRTRNEPSASVVLEGSGGGIGESQARTIQSIVAGSVEGLTVDNVTVADGSGRLLADGGGRSGQIGGSIDESRRMKEVELRQKIIDILEPVVGMGKVRAEVSMELSRNRTTVETVEFDPDSVVSATETETTEEQDTTIQDETTSVDANVADTAQNTSQDTSSREVSREIVRSEVGSTRTVQVVEPGELLSLNVAVQVSKKKVQDAAQDGSSPAVYESWGDAQIQAMTAQVNALLPTTPLQDGVITKTFTLNEFDWIEPPRVELDTGRQQIAGIDVESALPLVKWLMVGALGVLILLIVIKPILSRVLEAIPAAAAADAQAQLESQLAAAAPALTGPGGSVTEDTIAAALAGDEDAAKELRIARSSGTMSNDMKIASRIDVAQVEGRVQESAITRVAEIVRAHPDESAAIIRSWLYAD